MINLFISYFQEENPKRREEYDNAISSNIQNGLVDKMYFLAPEDTILAHPKSILIPFEGKPTYYDFIEIVNEKTDKDDINIIANLDIYFDYTLNNASAIKEGELYAMSHVDFISTRRDDSQDVWLFRGHLENSDDYKIQIGVAGCDNAIAHRFSKNGLSVSNPAKSINCHHSHKSNYRTYNPTIQIPKPYMTIEPTLLGEESNCRVLEPEGITVTEVETKPFVFVPEPKKYDDSIVATVKDRGVKVLHIGLCANGEPRNAMQDAFAALGEYMEIPTGVENLNQKIIEAAESYKPELTFIQVQTPDIISMEAVRALKKSGSWVCNWTGDVRDPLPEWYIEMGKEIDITLFCNETDVQRATDAGINAGFLQIGIDHNIYTPNGNVGKSPEIVFMGNNYNRKFPLSLMRNDMGQFLSNAFRHQFGIYGNGWGNAICDLNSSQTAEAEIYRNAKVAINISHFDFSRYSSDRIFRILGTGGAICLTKWYPDIEKDFEDGVHLRVWKNIQQLEGLCNYYLLGGKEEERLAIVSNGLKLCHEKYTFNSMANNVYKIYESNK